jgi:transcriptional regulator with XRE-family HTH domain
MITIEQIRAARGLINWSQGDLASATSLSLNAISNLEKGQSTPRTETLQQIQKSLEKAGVEFLSGMGVRLRGEIFEMEKIEGENLVTKQLDDMLNHLLETGKREIVFNGLDNSKLEKIVPGMGAVYMDYFKKFKSLRIQQKVLLREGDMNFLAPDNHYRWIEPELFGQIPYGVYGDTTSIFLWGPPLRLVQIRNAAIAETFRQQFYALWDIAKPIPDTVFSDHHRKK